MMQFHTNEPPEPKAKRRQRRGSAWYWEQTDSWYFTPPGTKQRLPLLDERGRRIRGSGNKRSAQLALARVRLQRGLKPAEEASDITAPPQEAWLVARVCSEYLAHCQRAVAAGRMHPDYRKEVVRYSRPRPPR